MHHDLTLTLTLNLTTTTPSWSFMVQYRNGEDLGLDMHTG